MKGLRIVASLTLIFFLPTSVATGQFVSPASRSLTPESSWGAPFLNRITIPAELGTIEFQHQGEGGSPFIVLIQDAHAILDVQEKIQSLIGHLENQYGIDLIALEGGKGELDPTLFRAFPDEGIKKKALRPYLERGELTGAEMAAIFNSKEAIYYGIENWKLYEENYLAYLRAMQTRERALQKLKELKSQLDQERVKQYAPKLNDFHNHVEAFQEEKASLFELLKYLNQNVIARSEATPARSRYPHLSRLFQSVEKDSSLPKESLEVSIRRLAESFKHQYRAKLDRGTLMQFNIHHQAFLSGQRDPGTFLKDLLEIGRTLGVKPKLTPLMQELLGHVEMLSTLKGTKLFEELQSFLEEMEAGLMTKPEEKELAAQYKQIRLLNDLANLELTREGWEKIRTSLRGSGATEAISNAGLLRRPAKQSPGLLAMTTQFAPHLSFYELAEKRDLAFHRNLKKLLHEKKRKAAIVLAGGFHTKGFEEMLQKEGFSYVVISPQMNSLDGKERYGEVMQGKLSYKDYLETTFYDAFVRHSSLGLVKELSEPDFKRGLKLWRDEVIRKLASEGRTGEAGEYTRYIDLLLKVYRDKWGLSPQGTVPLKAEILKAIEKELYAFRDDTVNRLWEKFQIQFKELTQGLKSFENRPNVLVPQRGALIRDLHYSPPLLQFIKTGKIPLHGELRRIPASTKLPQQRSRAEVRKAQRGRPVSEESKRLHAWAKEHRNQKIPQTQPDLARRFGLSRMQVSNILKPYKIKTRGRAEVRSVSLIQGEERKLLEDAVYKEVRGEKEGTISRRAGEGAPLTTRFSLTSRGDGGTDPAQTRQGSVMPQWSLQQRLSPQRPPSSGATTIPRTAKLNPATSDATFSAPDNFKKASLTSPADKKTTLRFSDQVDSADLLPVVKNPSVSTTKTVTQNGEQVNKGSTARAEVRGVYHAEKFPHSGIPATWQELAANHRKIEEISPEKPSSWGRAEVRNLEINSTYGEQLIVRGFGGNQDRFIRFALWREMGTYDTFLFFEPSSFYTLSNPESPAPYRLNQGGWNEIPFLPGSDNVIVVYDDTGKTIAQIHATPQPEKGRTVFKIESQDASIQVVYARDLAETKLEQLVQRADQELKDPVGLEFVKHLERSLALFTQKRSLRGVQLLERETLPFLKKQLQGANESPLAAFKDPIEETIELVKLFPSRAEVRADSKKEGDNPRVLRDKNEVSKIDFLTLGKTARSASKILGSPAGTVMLVYQIPSAKAPDSFSRHLLYLFAWQKQKRRVLISRAEMEGSSEKLRKFRTNYPEIPPNREIKIDGFFSVRLKGRALIIRRLIGRGPESGNMIIVGRNVRRAEVRTDDSVSDREDVQIFQWLIQALEEEPLLKAKGYRFPEELREEILAILLASPQPYSKRAVLNLIRIFTHPLFTNRVVETLQESRDIAGLHEIIDRFTLYNLTEASLRNARGALREVLSAQALLDLLYEHPEEQSDFYRIVRFNGPKKSDFMGEADAKTKYSFLAEIKDNLPNGGMDLLRFFRDALAENQVTRYYHYVKTKDYPDPTRVLYLLNATLLNIENLKKYSNPEEELRKRAYRRIQNILDTIKPGINAKDYFRVLFLPADPILTENAKAGAHLSRRSTLNPDPDFQSALRRLYKRPFNPPSFHRPSGLPGSTSRLEASIFQEPLERELEGPLGWIASFAGREEIQPVVSEEEAREILTAYFKPYLDRGERLARPRKILQDKLRELGRQGAWEWLKKVRAEVRESGFGKKSEKFVPGDSGSTQVVQNENDKHRNGAVGGNDDRAADAGLGVNPVVSLLADKSKTGKFEDSTKFLVREGGNTAQSGSEGNFTVLGRDKRGGAPLGLRGVAGNETFFLQDRLQGAKPGTLFEKKPDGFLQTGSGLLDGVSAAPNGKLRTKTNVGSPFLKNKRGKSNPSHSVPTITHVQGPVKPSRAEVRSNKSEKNLEEQIGRAASQLIEQFVKIGVTPDQLESFEANYFGQQLGTPKGENHTEIQRLLQNFALTNKILSHSVVSISDKNKLQLLFDRAKADFLSRYFPPLSPAITGLIQTLQGAKEGTVRKDPADTSDRYDLFEFRIAPTFGIKIHTEGSEKGTVEVSITYPDGQVTRASVPGYRQEAQLFATLVQQKLARSEVRSEEIEPLYEYKLYSTLGEAEKKNERLEELRKFWKNPRRRVWDGTRYEAIVAYEKEGNKPVGIISFGFVGSRSFMNGIYVDPALQKQRIGSELSDALSDYLFKQGFDTFQIGYGPWKIPADPAVQGLAQKMTGMPGVTLTKDSNNQIANLTADLKAYAARPKTETRSEVRQWEKVTYESAKNLEAGVSVWAKMKGSEFQGIIRSLDHGMVTLEILFQEGAPLGREVGVFASEELFSIPLSRLIQNEAMYHRAEVRADENGFDEILDREAELGKMQLELYEWILEHPATAAVMELSKEYNGPLLKSIQVYGDTIDTEPPLPDWKQFVEGYLSFLEAHENDFPVHPKLKPLFDHYYFLQSSIRKQFMDYMNEDDMDRTLKQLERPKDWNPEKWMLVPSFLSRELGKELGLESSKPEDLEKIPFKRIVPLLLQVITERTPPSKTSGGRAIRRRFGRDILRKLAERKFIVHGKEIPLRTVAYFVDLGDPVFLDKSFSSFIRGLLTPAGSYPSRAEVRKAREAKTARPVSQPSGLSYSFRLARERNIRVSPFPIAVNEAGRPSSAEDRPTDSDPAGIRTRTSLVRERGALSVELQGRSTQEKQPITSHNKLQEIIVKKLSTSFAPESHVGVRVEKGSLIRVFLPELTEEEIVRTYLEGNQSYETLVNRWMERAVQKREEIRERIGKAIEAFLVDLTREMLDQETAEEIFAFLESEQLNVAIQSLSEKIRLAEVGGPQTIHDLVIGAAQRVLVLGEALISGQELSKVEKLVTWTPLILSLLALFEGNSSGLESLLNQAVKDESFRRWYGKTQGQEAPRRLFDQGAELPTANAAIFDLAIFGHLLKTGKVEEFRRMILTRSKQGRVAVAMPPRFGNMRGVVVPGADYVGYGEEGISVNRMAHRFSKDYREAMMLMTLGTPVDATHFEGFGYFTESSVIERLRLDPSSFVRLLELVHRSEHLWQLLKKDPKGREAFRVVDPDGIAHLLEFVYQLTQTEVAREALLRAA